ncbi:hypothetical protein PIB30_017268 [Stylosanthes scabra]|uniref:Uncharacterized protein n=1 Tax=Stylosanthes scabra TaxID=79078 RepID=A0ABU6Q7F4_9FABA|nr:hypothetical protein [Stylosanthes scabra]
MLEGEVTDLIEGNGKVQLGEDRNKKNNDEISIIMRKKGYNTVKEGSGWDPGGSKNSDSDADQRLLLTVMTTLSSFAGSIEEKKEAAPMAVAMGK